MGPATEHYRYLRIYNPTTSSEIISDTIKYIPTYIQIPEASIDDRIQKTVNDLVHLLLNKPPAIPALQLESSRVDLLQIAKLLNRDKTPPNIPAIPVIQRALPLASQPLLTHHILTPPRGRNSSMSNSCSLTLRARNSCILLQLPPPVQKI